jgi:hypothetical protein
MVFYIASISAVFNALAFLEIIIMKNATGWQLKELLKINTYLFHDISRRRG